MQAVLRYGWFNLLAACQIQSVDDQWYSLCVKDHHGRWLDEAFTTFENTANIFVEEFDVGASIWLFEYCV